ncbi:MarR family transcriptional regulator [Oceanotoga sp. DSM 15011]|jgi:DNA-binding MarR family transcriptional regulator|uniref:MarR family transcriptional regulator n=1 Tax=Oceanotoga teriensis TaxID=515440 RepID=A0AA45C554_9BACT|nr:MULTISPECIES: MarR family transcriptional regulator [Oceanotoga]MDN5341938.1 hypothetical protein [Oceanotoga sp.]MDO7976550.1 MarR family transcriptional regulator [Oceanotoga teriensis]PWJ87907.1 MarR family transcriptional regulator [Oceanotoga teriensis]UYO99266.1 MarR family transcriptional regulator [Oceanotoga sp. DSM 15011]
MDEKSKGILILKQMKRIMDLFHKNMKNEFEEINLTRPQGMLIGYLFQKGECKISDLSEYMELSNSTVSGIVDRLEKQKIVERNRDEKDRRVVKVSITEDFKKNSNTHYKKIEGRFSEIFENVEEKDLKFILKGLKKLEKIIEINTEESKE